MDSQIGRQMSSRSDSLILKSAYLKGLGMTAELFFYRKNQFAPFHAFITHLYCGTRNAVNSISSFPFSFLEVLQDTETREQNVA